MKISTTCKQCKTTDSVDVFEEDYDYYRRGALVQEAFPDLSLSDREIIIGSRSGFYLCETCFDNLGSEV